MRFRLQYPVCLSMVVAGAVKAVRYLHVLPPISIVVTDNQVGSVSNLRQLPRHGGDFHADWIGLNRLPSGHPS